MNDMSAWKYWVIMTVYPSSTRSHSAPQQEQATSPPSKPHREETSSQLKVSKKDMKRKFKKLLDYKLCDANEVDVYAELIKTLENLKQ